MMFYPDMKCVTHVSCHWVVIYASALPLWLGKRLPPHGFTHHPKQTKQYSIIQQLPARAKISATAENIFETIRPPQSASLLHSRKYQWHITIVRNQNVHPMHQGMWSWQVIAFIHNSHLTYLSVWTAIELQPCRQISDQVEQTCQRLCQCVHENKPQLCICVL